MNEAQKQVALIQASSHKFKSLSRAVEDNTNPRALSSIDEIFTRLKAIGSVGNAFKTPDEERIVKQEWMLAMHEEGVTKQHMIDDGIEAFRVKARKSSHTIWFPTIGKFIELCKGSEDVMEYAKRALDLFNRAQRQIDTIGQMVAGKHGYDLKRLTADKSNKEFIDLYLRYAQDNAIESLDAFVLTDGVTLSAEQFKDAEERKQAAQNECLNKLHSLFGKPAEKEAGQKSLKAGVKTGSTKVYSKTPAQLDAERERQLRLIKGLK